LFDWSNLTMSHFKLIFKLFVLINTKVIQIFTTFFDWSESPIRQHSDFFKNRLSFCQKPSRG
jgi:hypothetical protein